MSKEIERLRAAGEASARIRIREELQKMTGAELADTLYHVMLGAHTSSQDLAPDVVSECMHRLKNGAS